MQNTLSILEDLIRIPSFVANGSDEAQLADEIVSRLSSLPEQWRVTEQPVDGARRNIYVANAEDPSILLTAHLDTVPPTDAWIRNPFMPVREGSRLYGLGALDMKAGLAAILSILARKTRTAKKIAALFYVGEEYDFCGMKAFASQTSISPTWIISPEPTDLRVYRGCRGVIEFRFVVEGRAAHAAMGRDGVNAIELVQRATDALSRSLARLPDEGLGDSTVNLAWLRGGLPMGGNLIARANVVPSLAEAVIEIRIAHARVDEGFVRQALEKAVERRGGNLVAVDVAFRVGPMLASSSTESPFGCFEAGDLRTTGYFDIQLFIHARGGSPIVCGPGPSSVAHQADEYVNLPDVERLENTLARLF